MELVYAYNNCNTKYEKSSNVVCKAIIFVVNHIIIMYSYAIPHEVKKSVVNLNKTALMLVIFISRYV